MNRPLKALLVVTSLLAGASLQAQTTVSEPWVRGTVAQQKASGAFMKISSVQGARLLAVASPVAGVVEVHEMAMDGGVMKMRALPAGLDIPPGQTVELKPGSFHLMLMDLNQQLKPGESVPLTLVVERRDGRRETLQVQAAVRPLGAVAPAEHKH